MKPELFDMAVLASVLPADHLIAIPGGPVEILMTTNPVHFAHAIDDVHESYEFLVPLSGCDTFYLGQEQLDCRQGHLIIIKPGMRHGLTRATRNTSFVSIFLKASFLDNLLVEMVGTSENPFQCEVCLLHPDIQYVLSDLVNELRDHRVGRKQMVENLAQNLAIQLIRHYHIGLLEEFNLVDKPLTDAQGRFQGVLDYMHDHLDDKLTVEEMAGIAGMNRFHFIRMFKSAFGQSPYDYLTLVRIAQARRLLTHTRLPSNEIGVQCGYFSASRFAAAFRQNTGYTPSAYRSKMTGGKRPLDIFSPANSFSVEPEKA